MELRKLDEMTGMANRRKQQDIDFSKCLQRYLFPFSNSVNNTAN